MNFKKVFLFASFAVVFLLFILAFLPEEEKEERKTSTKEESPEPRIPVEGSTISLGSLYKDAPHPFDLDPKAVYQTEKLWPHLSTSKASKEDKEKVRQQWLEFANEYPENIYIPDYAKQPLTEAETQKIRQEVDLVADIEANSAVTRTRARSSKPGSEPPQEPAKPSLSPEKQRAYFAYKIREVKSKIQLIEYAIAKNRLDEVQMGIAKKDLENWKKQLKELQEVSDRVPKA
ncbi:MAG: hypothetical protein AAF518_15455 [Spirochaetota bacterium]